MVLVSNMQSRLRAVYLHQHHCIRLLYRGGYRREGRRDGRMLVSTKVMTWSSRSWSILAELRSPGNCATRSHARFGYKMRSGTRQQRRRQPVRATAAESHKPTERCEQADRGCRLPTRWSVVSESSLAREGNGSDTNKWDRQGPCHPRSKFRNFLDQNFTFSAPRKLVSRTSFLPFSGQGVARKHLPHLPHLPPWSDCTCDFGPDRNFHCDPIAPAACHPP